MQRRVRLRLRPPPTNEINRLADLLVAVATAIGDRGEGLNGLCLVTVLTKGGPILWMTLPSPCVAISLA